MSRSGPPFGRPNERSPIVFTATINNLIQVVWPCFENSADVGELMRQLSDKNIQTHVSAILYSVLLNSVVTTLSTVWVIIF